MASVDDVVEYVEGVLNEYVQTGMLDVDEVCEHLGIELAIPLMDEIQIWKRLRYERRSR